MSLEEVARRARVSTATVNNKWPDLIQLYVCELWVMVGGWMVLS